MTNVVIDLETLDTAPGATVLAIGACEVESGRTFYCSVNGDNGTESQDTLGFWCRGDLEQARQKLTQDLLPVREALAAFAAWMPLDCRVWGNGAAFDNVILRECYRRHGIPVPWHYSMDRDLRTLTGLFPLEQKPGFVGIPHFALDDAIHEARVIQAICEEYSLFLEP